MPSYSAVNMSGKVEFSVSGLLASVTAMTNGSMRDLQETVRPCRGAQVALVGPPPRSSCLAGVHYRIPTVVPNSLDLCKTQRLHTTYVAKFDGFCNTSRCTPHLSAIQLPRGGTVVPETCLAAVDFQYASWCSLWPCEMQ